MSDLDIRFNEATAAHIARGNTETAYGVSYGDLEAIARDFHLTMNTTVKLYNEWRKAKASK